jgi:glutaminyl-peptide cyclotransferase
MGRLSAWDTRRRNAVTTNCRRALLPRCIVTAALVLIAGCNRKPETTTLASTPIPTGSVSGERAMEEVRGLLAIGPRNYGTTNAACAATHIEARLRSLGLNPVLDEFTEQTPLGQTKFRNVTARIGPQDRPLVVLLSHYDTAAGIDPAFTGANDSGSSTGLLLELARILATNPPPHCSVLVAFLDGEESRTHYSGGDGLYGSRRLAARLRESGSATHVAGVILLDMIGDRDLTVTIPRDGTARLMTLALQCAKEEGVRERFGVYPGDITDDHVPFLEAGMPAVDLIDFEYGSSPGLNDFWHTPQDTLDKLSPASLQTVGRVVIRMLNALP